MNVEWWRKCVEEKDVKERREQERKRREILGPRYTGRHGQARSPFLPKPVGIS